jgi:hypothetical protein
MTSLEGSCLISDNTGLIQLTGPLTPILIQDIAVDESPVVISFSPRTTAPSIVSGRIDEGTDNTITYKGIKYILTGGVQICQPIHTGYLFPGQTVIPSAELYLTFTNSQISGSYPISIILVVPIYQASASNHAAYLHQIIDGGSPAASLQTIFYENEADKSQQSIGYKSCIDLSNNSSTDIFVVYFPTGISLTGQEFANLIGIVANGDGVGTLPTYQLPPASRGTLATVRNFTLADGIRQPTMFSPDGNLYVSSISTSSDEFKNRFVFYGKPPRLVGAFSKEQCTYYKTTQYKCVPFSKLQDLSGDYVIRGAKSLNQILDQQGQTIADATKIPDTNEAISKTEEIIEIGGGVILAAIVALGLGKLVMSLTK